MLQMFGGEPSMSIIKLTFSSPKSPTLQLLRWFLSLVSVSTYLSPLFVFYFQRQSNSWKQTRKETKFLKKVNQESIQKLKTVALPFKTLWQNAFRLYFPAKAVSSSQLFPHLYSQHVFSSPAVVHVSLLRLALTAVGAVGYKGKLEKHAESACHWESCTFLWMSSNKCLE